MNKKWFIDKFNKVKDYSTEHSPEILLAAGITGMISCTIMAVKATPKAIMIMNEKRVREHREDFTKMETVKSTWKCYVPSVIVGVMSTACLVGSGSVGARRRAALATAYTISETALSEYKHKVKEIVGNKKEKQIVDEVNQEKVSNNQAVSTDIIDTGEGKTLCYDSVSGRYFYSDIEYIRKVINDLNYRLIDEMYVSLNELYYELGIKSLPIGDDLGWSIDKGDVKINFTSALTKNKIPCLVLDYTVKPMYV